jgi:hypothetical protein
VLLSIWSHTWPHLASPAPRTTTQSLTQAWPSIMHRQNHNVNYQNHERHHTQPCSSLAQQLKLLHEPHLTPPASRNTQASQLTPELACARLSRLEPPEPAGVGQSYPEHLELTGLPPEPRTLPQRFL